MQKQSRYHGLLQALLGGALIIASHGANAALISGSFTSQTVFGYEFLGTEEEAAFEAKYPGVLAYLRSVTSISGGFVYDTNTPDTHPNTGLGQYSMAGSPNSFYMDLYSASTGETIRFSHDFSVRAMKANVSVSSGLVLLNGSFSAATAPFVTDGIHGFDLEWEHPLTSDALPTSPFAASYPGAITFVVSDTAINYDYLMNANLQQLTLTELSTVPIPASLPLLVSGLLSILGLTSVRRRNQKPGTNHGFRD